MKENFELQRERVHGVTIITYDKLRLRLERLVGLLEEPFQSVGSGSWIEAVQYHREMSTDLLHDAFEYVKKVAKRIGVSMPGDEKSQALQQPKTAPGQVNFGLTGGMHGTSHHSHTAWTIAKTAGEISKKLFEFGKSLGDREARQQVEEIQDKLRELKRQASELEDENRELRERLRFKSDECEFRTPFWYDKAHPDRALCAKCFAKGIPAPMGEPGQGVDDRYRMCLVCNDAIEVGRAGYQILRTRARRC